MLPNRRIPGGYAAVVNTRNLSLGRVGLYSRHGPNATLTELSVAQIRAAGEAYGAPAAARA